MNKRGQQGGEKRVQPLVQLVQFFTLPLPQNSYIMLDNSYK